MGFGSASGTGGVRMAPFHDGPPPRPLRPRDHATAEGPLVKLALLSELQHLARDDARAMSAALEAVS
eukprot:9417757-Pyramimonas_sp.AAC.1